MKDSAKLLGLLKDDLNMECVSKIAEHGRVLITGAEGSGKSLLMKEGLELIKKDNGFVIVLLLEESSFRDSLFYITNKTLDACLAFLKKESLTERYRTYIGDLRDEPLKVFSFVNNVLRKKVLFLIENIEAFKDDKLQEMFKFFKDNNCLIIASCLCFSNEDERFNYLSSSFNKILFIKDFKIGKKIKLLRQVCKYGKDDFKKNIAKIYALFLLIPPNLRESQIVCDILLSTKVLDDNSLILLIKNLHLYFRGVFAQISSSQEKQIVEIIALKNGVVLPSKIAQDYLNIKRDKRKGVKLNNHIRSLLGRIKKTGLIETSQVNKQSSAYFIHNNLFKYWICLNHNLLETQEKIKALFAFYECIFLSKRKREKFWQKLIKNLNFSLKSAILNLENIKDLKYFLNEKDENDIASALVSISKKEDNEAGKIIALFYLSAQNSRLKQLAFFLLMSSDYLLRQEFLQVELIVNEIFSLPCNFKIKALYIFLNKLIRAKNMALFETVLRFIDLKNSVDSQCLSFYKLAKSYIEEDYDIRIIDGHEAKAAIVMLCGQKAH